MNKAVFKSKLRLQFQLINYSIWLTSKLVIAWVLLSASTLTMAEVENLNSLYGKWTLNEINYKSGRSRDFTKEPGNFVHFKEHEISEIIAGHGVRTYPYTKEGDTYTLISGGEPFTWHVIERTESTMKIDTSFGRYILSR